MSHSRERDLSASDESAQQRAQHTQDTLDLLRCTAHPNECDICAEVLCAIAGNVGAWIASIISDRPVATPAQRAWQHMLGYARGLSDTALRHHARVSIDNRHKCKECFCCACVVVQRDRRKEWHDRLQ